MIPLIDPENEPEAWRPILEVFEQLGDQGIAERAGQTWQMLANDGALTQAGRDVRGRASDWVLDPIPVPVTSQTWQAIETGVIERSRLLNRLFLDIYGEQSLIKEGIIPAKALSSLPSFIRPLAGLPTDAITPLFLHGVDLVPTQKGWHVIGDRFQGPPGTANALENRLVLSKVFPSLFRNTQVHRLATFFQEVRAQLLNGLSEQASQPTVVVLSSGEYSPSAFEHSFLANYLGFPLVRGGDLMSKGGRIWLQTLEGEVQVDIILRRLDDAWCDPVELKGHSLLGVPGLLDAIRNRTVQVVNPIGSGVLESPIWFAYLDAISQHWNGRSLSIPGPKTLWAYQPEHLEAILDQPDNWVLRRTIWNQEMPMAVSVEQLDRNDKAKLLAHVRANPMMYTAQEPLSRQTMPCWLPEKGHADRPIDMRVFTLNIGDDFRVMPGGLLRVSDSEIEDRSRVITKDLWVRSSEPEVIKPIPMPRNRVSRSEPLPPRIAENLFWLGRYQERCDAQLRFLRTYFMLQNHATLSQVPTQAIDAFLTALKATSEISASDALDGLFQEEIVGSLAWNLNAMIQAAGEVRELLSADTLRLLHQLERVRVQLRLAGSLESRDLDELLGCFLALGGLYQESMLRDGVWHFLEAGRRLERGVQLSGFVRKALADQENDPVGIALLEAVMVSQEMLVSYRKRWQGMSEIASGIEMLSRDVGNPRSIAFQGVRFVEHARSLPKRMGRAPLKGLQTLEAWLQIPEGLDGFDDLDQFEKAMNQIANEMVGIWFEEDLPPQPFGMATPNNGMDF